MRESKSILCLVPLPPPVTGAALASSAVVDCLRGECPTIVVEYQRGNLTSGKFSFKQVFNILVVGAKILTVRIRNADLARVYMVCSTSLLGHLRDLFLFFCLGKRLRGGAILHIHTSNNGEGLPAIAPRGLKRLARNMFRDIRRGVVLGETWRNIYGEYLGEDKIFEVNNFFSPELLIPLEGVYEKYQRPGKLSILFLSNMIKAKGYDALLDAFITLPEKIRDRAELNFAGHFNSETEKKRFLEKISDFENIFYHGPVYSNDKRDLLWRSHIFCLPTIYSYEAQPIVLLEAYAAGAVVITTSNRGLSDVFSDKRNGAIIRNSSTPEALRANLAEVLIMAILDQSGSEKIALSNRQQAIEKYSLEIFQKKIKAVILS